jgi:hypothetical protein
MGDRATNAYADGGRPESGHARWGRDYAYGCAIPHHSNRSHESAVSAVAWQVVETIPEA